MQFTFEELFIAYLTCRKSKRNSPNHLQFEEHLEENLFDLYEDLINKRYEIGTSIYFILEKPKYREVWAADFRDRIVHHLIYNRLSPDFFKTFIYDSSACIPTKGTLFASNRLNHFVKSSTNNFQTEIYYLKADIKNFFLSIDKNILWNIISNHPLTIKHSNQFEYNNLLLQLINQIIYHNPTTNYQFKGNKSLIKYVPSHKQLFNVEIYKGLPIGNLTSQFFANIYLDSLDKYIKHQLKVKYYVRYVDDIVLLDKKPKKLNDNFSNIENHLLSNRNMFFHKNKTIINKTTTGIDFVGRIVHPFHIKIRNRTISSFNLKINENIKHIPLNKDKYLPSFNSYLGIMKHSNSFNIRKDIITTKLLPFGYSTTKIYNKIISY